MNPQQRAAFDTVCIDRQNTFITGPAGCGKSYLIHEIVAWAHGNNVRIGVTASTGAAAILLGGRTVHSFLGIGLAKTSARDLAGKTKRVAKYIVKRVRDLELLIIDEISMISDELLDKISEYLQILRGDTQPFGGIQIVLCGDFHQLPSIDGDFAFHADEWHRARMVVHMLTINMRQRNDEEFQDILGRARIGQLLPSDVERLESLRATDFAHGIQPTRLFSRRADVDRINTESFKRLLASGRHRVEFKTEFSCNEAERWAASQGIPAAVELCEGAQVVVTWNINLDTGIVNGTRGIVQSCNGTTSVTVTTRNGTQITIEKITVKDEDNPEIRASYLPLQLAYSLTFHKCQGMTLDAAEIDVGPSVFEFGQAYTALSRVKNLASLRVSNIVRKSFRAHPEVIDFYASVK